MSEKNPNDGDQGDEKRKSKTDPDAADDQQGVNSETGEKDPVAGSSSSWKRKMEHNMASNMALMVEMSNFEVPPPLKSLYDLSPSLSPNYDKIPKRSDTPDAVVSSDDPEAATPLDEAMPSDGSTITDSGGPSEAAGEQLVPSESKSDPASPSEAARDEVLPSGDPGLKLPEDEEVDEDGPSEDMIAAESPSVDMEASDGPSGGPSEIAKDEVLPTKDSVLELPEGEDAGAGGSSEQVKAVDMEASDGPSGAAEAGFVDQEEGMFGPPKEGASDLPVGGEIDQDALDDALSSTDDVPLPRTSEPPKAYVDQDALDDALREDDD